MAGTFTAVVVSHAFERGLRNMLGVLMYQTRPPDDTIVMHSGYDPGVICRLAEDFPHVDGWFRHDDQRDFGHAKRADGIAQATGDYLGFFNDDDSYAADYLEKMMAAVAETGVAYCGWNEQPGCVFKLSSSTAGNFIVNTTVARQAGYKGRDYTADGDFINRLRELTRPVKVDEVLYHHNALERP